MTACQVCAEPVDQPLALCWDCAALAGDALVFIRRPETASEHDDALDVLRSALPGRPRSEDLSLAARGHKAVALVPMDESERVRELFRAHDVEVQVVQRTRARAPLPVGLRLVVALVAVVGSVAGLLSEPLLLLTSPVMAGLLWIAAQRQLRRPLVGTGA